MSNYVKLSEQKFIPEKFGTILSRKYRLENRYPTTVLNYLKATAVRYEHKNDLGLHKRYWKKGYLASTKSLRDLAYDFGYKGLTQIRNIIKMYVDRKELYIESVDVGQNKPQNIYIVGLNNGRVGNDYEEIYFTEINYNERLGGIDLEYVLAFWGVSKNIISWNDEYHEASLT